MFSTFQDILQQTNEQTDKRFLQVFAVTQEQNFLKLQKV